jgi:hypothetical protein
MQRKRASRERKDASIERDRPEKRAGMGSRSAQTILERGSSPPAAAGEGKGGRSQRQLGA